MVMGDNIKTWINSSPSELTMKTRDKVLSSPFIVKMESNWVNELIFNAKDELNS